ncbi:MAG: response regulator, partial [Comamonadaceae bacterium]
MAKILVVDDIPVNRALVVTLVGHSGHQALEASDGAQALAMVRAERPDLVISDILMPTMDGFEFVRQMRADPELAGTQVIFYSAHYRE